MLQAIYEEIDQSVRSRNDEILDRLLRRHKQPHPEQMFACQYMSHRWDEYCLDIELECELKKGHESVNYYQIKYRLNQHRANWDMTWKPCGKCKLCKETFGPFVQVAGLIVQSHDFDPSWLRKVEQEKRWKNSSFAPTFHNYAQQLGWKLVKVEEEERRPYQYPQS
jgi:hypothetical protein